MTNQTLDSNHEPANQPSLIEEIRRETRKQITKSLARWVFAVIAALAIMALMGWWLYLKPYMITEFGGVPRGGVLAFDRDDLTQEKCPPGWSPFVLGRGRVLIGAGDPSKGDKGVGSDDKPLTIRNLRDSGGAEMHKLEEGEIPAHKHMVEDPGHSHRVSGGYSTKGGTKGPGGGELTVGNYAGGDHYSRKQMTGIKVRPNDDGSPHENMPPYIALFFCKKNSPGQ